MISVEGFSINRIHVVSMFVGGKRAWSVEATAYVSRQEDSPSFGFHITIANHVYYYSLREAVDSIIEPSKKMGVPLGDYVVATHNNMYEVDDSWKDIFLKEINRRGWEAHIQK